MPEYIWQNLAKRKKIAYCILKLSCQRVIPRIDSGVIGTAFLPNFMRFTAQKLKFARTQPIKIQIISRELPVENTRGNATYMLDLMRYLRQKGFELELICLGSSPAGKIPWYIVSPTVRELVKLSARDNVRVGSMLLRFKSFSEWFAALKEPVHTQFWLFYIKLPKQIKNIYRSARKILRLWSKQVVRSSDIELQATCYDIEHEAWDALATPEEIAFISKQFSRSKPDVIIANYACLADVLDALPPNEAVLKVILAHDIRYQRVTEFKKAGIALGGLDWDWEKESVQFRKAQVLLAIQEEDARVIKEMAPLSEVICTPMSAVCHSYAIKQVPGRCLFVGSDANHNVHGLQWFLNQVWPLILQSVPDSSLHVCGTVCELIQETFPNVHFLGRIEDLKPEYTAAEVCLVPLLVGSGLKIKLVEALSYNRACVSTSIGVQGLCTIASKAVIVADAAPDFADSVDMLLTNTDKRRCMENQARQYVKERLSPEAAYQPFVDCMYQHLSSGYN
jgi:glycosyltransferase involved in cell wall biosynthesis